MILLLFYFTNNAARAHIEDIYCIEKSMVLNTTDFLFTSNAQEEWKKSKIHL